MNPNENQNIKGGNVIASGVYLALRYNVKEKRKERKIRFQN
jgi:hypothetical protein